MTTKRQRKYAAAAINAHKMSDAALTKSTVLRQRQRGLELCAVSACMLNPATALSDTNAGFVEDHETALINFPDMFIPAIVASCIPRDQERVCPTGGCTARNSFCHVITEMELTLSTQFH